MTEQQPGSLIFQYLGDRNYITISQIFRGYFNLSNIYWDSTKLQEFAIRIKKPIKRQCRLIDPVLHANLNWRKEDIAVEFRIKESGRYFKHYFVSDGEVIVGHAQDRQPDWNKILTFTEGSVRLNQPSGIYITDFMMGFGKALIMKNTCLNPRVVEFYIEDMIRTEDEMDYVMELDPSTKKHFWKLNLFKRGQWMGHLWFWSGLG